MKVSTKCNPVTVNVTYPRITFLLFLTSAFFSEILTEKKNEKKGENKKQRATTKTFDE